MAIINAVQKVRSVADPIATYESMKDIWRKNRAVCSGERFVKSFDGVIDVSTFKNLLIPFSPSMSQEQYDFYKAEAEFPGITSQYAKMIVGGLLRKQPTLKLPDGAPEDAYRWIMDGFTQDNSPLISFLDTALWEEVQTSRAWVFLDYPKIDPQEAKDMTKEDFLELKPYPSLVVAESIINWKMSTDKKGKQKLTQLIIRGFEESFGDNEFHAELRATVWVHELVNDLYQIRKYQKRDDETSVAVVAGKRQKDFKVKSEIFELIETNTNLLINGERMTEIPAWPLNGSIEISEAMLSPIIDREVGLYNKISRRNHLLYGASTYTPIISSDMPDSQFQEIVATGLGGWIRLQQGDTATVLDTPTAALSDMETAITNTIADMAKLGIRMLTPEAAQSGVALEIRNAAQTAQLGTLNIKISSQVADIISFMLNWRYGTEYTSSDVEFSLSSDFTSAALDFNWLRLITEWYQAGLIPRSSWLQILKLNDIMPPDYNDDDGQAEINEDELIMAAKSVDTQSYTAKLQMEQGLDPATGLPPVAPEPVS